MLQKEKIRYEKGIFGVLLFCLLLGMTMPTLAAETKELPYYVTVNLTDNIVTVYEKDEKGDYTVPKKAFLCSVGKSTPEGSFQTSQKYDWRFLFGDVWGQYATRITGHYLFHSVPYFEKDKSALEYEEYNKLGTTASMGCIRLTVKDAKWLYDNCPIGTTVKMYRGDVEEPLQPAAVQKLNVKDTARRGWDPTDPDAKNPWRKGEMRQLAVEPSLFGSEVSAYYEAWTYYLDAEQAEKLFHHLGVKGKLLAAAKSADDMVSVEWNGENILLNCREKEGTIYYKLRDLMDMAGVEMTWHQETESISLNQGEKTVLLSRVSEIRETVSLPEKLAGFFLG